MNKYKDQAHIGGAAVHKELQGFAAFHANQSCHQDSGPITKAMIEASFGLKSLATQMMQVPSRLRKSWWVVSEFLHHYMKAVPHLELILALEHNRHYSWNLLFIALGAMLIYQSAVPSRVLQFPYYSKVSCVRNKTNVTSRTVQEQQQGDCIKILTLLTGAQEINKNSKKVLACVMLKNSPYRDYAITRNLPSSMVHENYVQCLLEKKFIVLNPNEAADCNSCRCCVNKIGY